MRHSRPPFCRAARRAGRDTRTVGEVVIPENLARSSVAWEGERARRWLDDLPRLVAELAETWSLDIAVPYEPGGNISWVAPVVRRTDGQAAVLKVQLPHPESAPEALALRAWGGEGAVRLFEADPERCALLIERCDPGTSLLDQGGALAAVRAGAEMAACLHAVPLPDEIPSLESVLALWADEVEGRAADQGPWLDPGLVATALELMRSLSPSRVLLHGDLNPTNVLAAKRTPWLAIDPKPMSGDPARDGARLVLQPDPGTPAVLRDRLAVVAEVLSVARERLAAWCLADAVEMATSARATGDEPRAQACAAQTTLIAPELG